MLRRVPAVRSGIPEFIGPHAITPGARHNEDSRDYGKKEPYGAASPNGRSGPVLPATFEARPNMSIRLRHSKQGKVESSKDFLSPP